MINVQYLPCGHVSETDDPELVKLDAFRQKEGFLDALILPSSQCEDCAENRRFQEQLSSYYDMDLDG